MMFIFISVVFSPAWASTVQTKFRDDEISEGIDHWWGKYEGNDPTKCSIEPLEKSSKDRIW